MKYCVTHNLRLETPAKQDKMHNDISLRIGGKPVWGKTIVSKGQDEEGYSTNNLIIRFDNEADMDDLFEFIKDKMDKIPVLKGTVTKHNCTHDEKPFRPCVISGKYEK